MVRSTRGHVVIVGHIHRVVMDTCTKVTVLGHGVILAGGPGRDVT